jgi:hypothetical protein
MYRDSTSIRRQYENVEFNAMTFSTDELYFTLLTFISYVFLFIPYEHVDFKSRTVR